MDAPLRVVADFSKTGKEVIDNQIFRLHYQLTFAILLTGSAAITLTHFVVDPIQCNFEGVPAKFADTFCWTHSTFTNPGNFSLVGVEPMPTDDIVVVHHNYYQWVSFALFAQAVAFYIPRYIWKLLAGGKVRMLLQDLPSMAFIKDPKKQTQIWNAVKYLRTHRKTFLSLQMKYIGCQVLNLANTVGQIFFINTFLGGQFLTYGVDIFRVSEDPMSVVFPKMAKCTFNNFAHSGTIEIKDGLCVLPLNSLNEKIYIFLWFWLIALAAVTAVGLCCDTCKLRRRSIHNLDRQLNIGVRFAIEMLGKNLDEDTTDMIRKKSQQMRLLSASLICFRQQQGSESCRWRSWSLTIDRMVHWSQLKKKFYQSNRDIFQLGRCCHLTSSKIVSASK